MNYLIYPCSLMWITQNYNGLTSHYKSSKGTPKSYPIDDQSDKNTKEAWFYGCCDELEVIRKYGVDGKASNTIWLQSTTPVVTPTFTDYVTIMIAHPNDSDLNKIEIGQKFKRYEKIFPAGKDGATGRHHHIEVGKGKYAGWLKNSKGAWIIKNGVKPEDSFYIDERFTTIYKDKGIRFKFLPKEPQYTEGIYETLCNLNIRKGSRTSYSKVKVKDCTSAMKKALTSSKQNDNAIIKKGKNITALQVIYNKDNSVWIKNYSGYVCLKGKKDIYLKKVG